MSSVLPFTYKIGTTTQCPFPGAYIFTGSIQNASNGMVPIYTSMPSFADSGTALSEFLNDKGVQVLVLPGYSLQLYTDSSFGTLNSTADNSGGTDVLHRNAGGGSSSCKLFYKFRTGYAEIPSKLLYTVTLTTTASSSNFTINGTTITNPVTYNGVQYRLYPFTSTVTPGSFSITDTVGVGLEIPCILIGGGGGGGNSGSTTGAGGGGAGTLLTTMIRVIPGATFTVYVGAGGAGALASSNTAGTAGSPTYITRTYNTVVDASLNAGGGGSGGAADLSNGKIGTYYGSTGGGYGLVARAASTAAGTAYTITPGNAIFTNITAATFAGGSGVATGAGGGGGGGAGAVGANGTAASSGGAGGAGLTWTVTGTGLYYAGGGGGMKSSTAGSAGAGGSGGGGSNGGTGTANTGGGGGAGFTTTVGGAGGSGLCIIAIPLYRLAA